MKPRFMCILLVLSIVIFSNVAPVRAAPVSAGITTPAEMEHYLDGVITDYMGKEHIPGMVVTVVKNGKVFFAKGYGYANVAQRIPVDPQQTLFRIGSTSKLFLWTAVMQLMEQGKLDLDADINRYLDFRIPATFSEPITMKNLMTHTSGFEQSNIGFYTYDSEYLSSLGDYLKKHIPARVFSPGKVGAYSNYGAALAGYIVERISGMSYAEYIEKNIFQPLGMSHSTILQPLPNDLAPEMAAGYKYVDGQYKQGRFELFAGYPAGAISATANDIAEFMIAHLQNGRYGDARILSEGTAQQMHSLLEAYDPRFQDGMSYGFIRQHVNGQLDLWHNGGTEFFHSGLHLLPDQDLGFFIATNGMGEGSQAAIFRAFIDHYFPPASAPEFKIPADMTSRAALYTGEYYEARSDFTGIEKITNLFEPHQVSVDEKGYVLVDRRKYVEVKPGFLQGVENTNPIPQLALRADKNGRTYLIASMPYALIKAAWYQTQAFHLSVLGISLLFLLITLISWIISFVVALIKKRRHGSQALLARLARAAGILFIILLLVFFIGFVREIFLNVDPLTSYPLFFIGVPTLMPVVLLTPTMMVVIGIALLVFTWLAWTKGFWTLPGRLHYTLLTLAAWSMLWELAYWNFWL